VLEIMTKEDLKDTKVLPPMPDVGWAITINQMAWDRNRDRRVDSLSRRREETYAVRDLWLNLHRGKSRYISDVTGSARGSVLLNRSCNHANARHRRGHGQGHGQDMVRQSTTSTIPSDRFVTGSQSAPAGKFRVAESLIPYHTAITMPPDKSKEKVTFNALNRKLVCRLPHVNDVPHFKSHEPGDVSEWKNEIKKIVPSRPKIFLPANAEPRPAHLIYPQEFTKPYNSLCYFRPVVDNMAGKGKEYMINPEWPSERSSPVSARFRSEATHDF